MDGDYCARRRSSHRASISNGAGAVGIGAGPLVRGMGGSAAICLGTLIRKLN